MRRLIIGLSSKIALNKWRKHNGQKNHSDNSRSRSFRSWFNFCFRLQKRDLRSRKRRKQIKKVAILTAILAFLTSLFNNGGSLLKQVVALFRENPVTTKQKIDQANEAETRERAQGGRPKWN